MLASERVGRAAAVGAMGGCFVMEVLSLLSSLTAVDVSSLFIWYSRTARMPYAITLNDQPQSELVTAVHTKLLP